jgi:hypothetical protein
VSLVSIYAARIIVTIGTPRKHKYGESTNDSNYGSCTSIHFRGGTYEISGRIIVVGQRVHCESLRADTV